MKYNINDKVTSVINSIPNPVIVISNDELQSAICAFFDFFNISTIEEFNATYGSIVNLFVKNNGFFTISNINNNQSWTDYLFFNPEVTRIVSMLNRNQDLIDFCIS